MKTLRFFGMALTAVLLSVGFASCSSDDDDDIINEICGTWSGYDDANYRYATATFNKDKTGSAEFTSSRSHQYYTFTYKVSGSKIILNGEYAGYNFGGDAEEHSFSDTYTYDGTHVTTGFFGIKLSKQ